MKLGIPVGTICPPWTWAWLLILLILVAMLSDLSRASPRMTNLLLVSTVKMALGLVLQDRILLTCAVTGMTSLHGEGTGSDVFGPRLG